MAYAVSGRLRIGSDDQVLDGSGFSFYAAAAADTREKGQLLYALDRKPPWSISFGTYGPALEQLQELDVAIPADEEDVYTYQFRPKVPFDFLTAPVGVSQEGVTANNRYDLQLIRASMTTWQFHAKPHRGGPGTFPGVREADLILDVRGDALPWRHLRIRFATSDAGVQTSSGDITLEAV